MKVFKVYLIRKEGTFLEQALKQMEKFTQNLEVKVVYKELELINERKKVLEMKEMFVPRTVLQEIESYFPEFIDNVSIAFIEVLGMILIIVIYS